MRTMAFIAGVVMLIALAAGCAATRDKATTVFDEMPAIRAEQPQLPERYQPGIDVTDAPDWWLTQPGEILEFLKGLPGVEVKEIGRTAGGRPIIAAEWGQDDMTRPGLMFVGAAHGTEFEGTVAMLNHLNIVVTGKDLVGREKPEMAEVGRKFRYQIIPILNVDGRERIIDHVQWIGVNSHYFYAITQGVFKDGRFLRWEENRQHQPMTYDNFAFFGSYRNDAGYNPVRERTDESNYQPENQALLRYARETRPDAAIFSHSNNGSLITPRVSRTIPEEFIRHMNQLAYQVALRCHQSDFSHPRYQRAPQPPSDRVWASRPFEEGRLYYHTDHAYQASGMFPVHVEFPQGWDGVPDTHLELLDIGLAVIDEICRYIVEHDIKAMPPAAPEG